MQKHIKNLVIKPRKLLKQEIGRKFKILIALVVTGFFALNLGACGDAKTPETNSVPTINDVKFSGNFTQAKIIYVIPNGKGDKDGSSWRSATTLDKALEDAQPYSTIFVGTGIYSFSKKLQLKSNVRIYGGFDALNDSLPRKPKQSVFNDMPGESSIFFGGDGEELDNAVLDGFSFFKNTLPIYLGSKTKTVLLSNLNFYKNEQCIKSETSSLIRITDSTFEHNTSITPIVRAENLEIVNSRFENNTNKGTGESGIVNSSKAIIKDSIFLQNKSERDGGAIHTTEELLVTNSKFTYNKSVQNGGAIYASGSVLEIDSSDFISNDSANTASAIYSEDISNLTINGSNFSDNKKCDIRVVTSSDKNNKIKDSNFSESKTRSFCEGSKNITFEGNQFAQVVFTEEFPKDKVLYVSKNGYDDNDGKSWSNAKIDLAKAMQNASKGTTILVGKGIYYADINKTDVNKTFTLNNGVRVYGGFNPDNLEQERAFDGTEASTILEADIGNDRFTSTLINAKNITDTSVLDGLVIRNANKSAAKFDTVKKVSLKNLYFLKNSAPADNYNGGGAINIKNESELNIRSSSFISNGYTTKGGAIYIDNSKSTVVIDSSKFKKNTLSKNETYGGAIYNKGTLLIMGSEFEENDAGTGKNYGGAIYSSGSIYIISSKFTSNNAASGGGAIYSIDSYLLIDTSSFDYNNSYWNNQNSFGGCGGAVFSENGSLDIQNSSFEYNKAYYGGGAICKIGKNSNIKKTSFSSNEAIGHSQIISFGGAIFNKETNQTMSETIFSYNKAKRGGAIYNSDESGSNPNKIKIEKSFFLSNDATNNEGNAIYDKGSIFKITNVLFGLDCKDSSYKGLSLYLEDSKITTAKLFFYESQGLTTTTTNKDYGVVYKSSSAPIINAKYNEFDCNPNFTRFK